MKYMTEFETTRCVGFVVSGGRIWETQAISAPIADAASLADAPVRSASFPEPAL